MRASLVLLLLVVGCLAFDRTSGSYAATEDAGRLEGTWRLIVARHGGQPNIQPTSNKTEKHITGTHVVTVNYDEKTGTVLRSAGGTYQLRDGKFVEQFDYGTSAFEGVFQSRGNQVRGKSRTFDLRIDGRLMTLTEKADGGDTVELWERVLDR